VLASAGEGRLFWSNYRVDLQPLKAALAAGNDDPVEGDDPDGEGKRCLVAARPVHAGGQQMGWLYVVPMSGEGKNYVPDLMRSYAMRTGITVSLMTIALGVLLTITIIAVLTRPLIGLTRMVERVRASGFTEEVCSASVPNCSLGYASTTPLTCARLETGASMTNSWVGGPETQLARRGRFWRAGTLSRRERTI